MSPVEGVVDPTTPLALTVKETPFQGFAIRLATIDGKMLMPLIDIANALSMDRSNLNKLLKRNLKLFEGENRLIKFTTPGGAQDLMCVTEKGAIGLLYKVDAARSKVPEIEKRIVHFQKWATETIQKEMQVQSKPPVQEMVRPASGNVSEVIGKYMEGARAASREMGVPLDLAMAKALFLAGRDLHMDLTGFARLLPAATTENYRSSIAAPITTFTHEGYLSAEEIAMRLGGGLRGKNVNKYLRNHGFVYKNEEGMWCMTDLGAQYGKVFPYAAGSGHVGYYICWRPEVMRASGMLR